MSSFWWDFIETFLISHFSDRFLKESLVKGTELDKIEHKGVILTNHTDLKISVPKTLEILGVKNTLGTLCLVIQ